MSERGKYIVIEGSDATGKTTQAERVHQHLGNIGIKRLDFVVNEPDGVPVAQELRKLIKNGTFDRDPWANVTLFTAARCINWLQAMKPALDRGEWVVAARSWISTAVYQGYGEGVDIDKIEAFTRENVGDEYMNPDLALILDVQDEKVRKTRIAERGELEHPDTFESKPQEFQDSMKSGYGRFAEDHGIEVIDASNTKDEVEALIWQQVESKLLSH